MLDSERSAEDPAIERREARRNRRQGRGDEGRTPLNSHPEAHKRSKRCDFAADGRTRATRSASYDGSLG